MNNPRFSFVEERFLRLGHVCGVLHRTVSGADCRIDRGPATHQPFNASDDAVLDIGFFVSDKAVHVRMTAREIMREEFLLDGAEVAAVGGWNHFITVTKGPVAVNKDEAHFVAGRTLAGVEYTLTSIRTDRCVNYRHRAAPIRAAQARTTD
jgi:hypothetical protein